MSPRPLNAQERCASREERVQRAWAFGLCAALCASCDFEERTPDTLQIVAPPNESTLQEADDRDRSTPGTQIAVTVEGARDGDVVELYRLLGGPPMLVATATLERGAATFPLVTLFPGANRLQARDRRTGHMSLPITLYLEAPCSTFTFVEPRLPEGAAELVLGPLDDQDGVPCGEGYETRVIAATGLPDGTRVTLLADGLPLRSGTTRGGTLVLDAVPLDVARARLERDRFTLSLRVDDGQCATGSPLPVYLDCAGPACEILPFASASVVSTPLDVDPTIPGIQIDLEVASSDDARGEAVELIINDNLAEPLTSPVALEGDPVALFEKISLPEGDVRLRAVCRDAKQNRTESARRTVLVDSVGCAISITAPTMDAVFVPPAPEAPVEVALTATFQGGDCRALYTAISSDERCEGLFEGPAETLAVGQNTLMRTFEIRELGPHTLCVGIMDMNHNESQASVRVNLEPLP